METQPLSGPNPRLEWCVVAFIPPAARETVAGDLFEQYRSPIQYLVSALRTLPFVIMSQIRRQSNVPVLIIQALTIAACITSLMLSLRQHVEATNIGLIAGTIMLVIVISEVYGGTQPVSEKRAVFEAIIFAVTVLAYAYAVLIIRLHGDRLHDRVLSWSLFSWLILPFGMPILCALRAWTVLRRSDGEQWVSDDLSRDELARHYEGLLARARACNLRDFALLILTGILSALIFWQARLKLDQFGSMLAAAYAVTPLYLLFQNRTRPMTASRDFLSLREAIQREIVRQHQLKAFVGWLWPVPVLALLYSAAFRFSGGPDRQLWMVYATIAALFGSYLILTANRDRNASLQGITDQLDRLRERPSG